MIHFDFELLKMRPKGKLADAKDGAIKTIHTLQSRESHEGLGSRCPGLPNGVLVQCSAVTVEPRDSRVRGRLCDRRDRPPANL